MYKIARYYVNYYNNKLEIDDLFQAGMMGLLKAAEKFDITMNTAFSTYATFWIKQSIIRTILDTGLEIRVPVHMIDTINKVMKESFFLSKELIAVTDIRTSWIFSSSFFSILVQISPSLLTMMKI